MKVLPLSDQRALVARFDRDDVGVDCPRFFTDEELREAGAFRLPKRREEWLRARMAAKQLAVERGIVGDPRECRVGRPYLIGTDWFVSISHSAPYAGAIIDRAPVGIDVQVVRALSESGTHLFLMEGEEEMMRSCTLPDRALHFWCAKEAAWKPRSGTYDTLKQLPLRLLDQREDGLLFDLAETRLIADVIVALTRPTF